MVESSRRVAPCPTGAKSLPLLLDPDTRNCMSSRRFIPLAVLLLHCVQSFVAVADETADAAKAAPVDPSGSWKWEYNINDNPAEFSLNLIWDGKQLTGK